MGRQPKTSKIESQEPETPTSTSERSSQHLYFDDRGLRNGIQYVFDESGFVDWSKMIDSKYIVANRSNFKNRQQPVPSDISSLDDKDKLVLLWGFKKVAQLRGYNSIRFIPIVAHEGFISLECQICWRGNYETGFQDVCFAGCGDAHMGNTFSFAQKYLTAIAENRAFVRSVRNSLNIPILGQDEIGPTEFSDETTNNQESGAKVSPFNLLDLKLKEKGKSFESLKQKIENDKLCDTTGWEKPSDVPVEKILTILGKYF